MRTSFNHYNAPTHDTDRLRSYTATPAAALVTRQELATFARADTLRFDEDAWQNAFTYLSNCTLRGLRQELSDRGRVVRDGRAFTSPGEMQHLLRTSVLPLSLAEIVPQIYELHPQGARVLVALMRQRALEVPEWLDIQAKKMAMRPSRLTAAPL